ncbi:MAG: DegQ family serine endoprotease [Alphaproteobacteria bacterium]
MRMVLVALLSAALAASGQAQTTRAVPQSMAQLQLSFAPVVAKVAPSVVNVYSRRVVRQPLFNDPFFRFFGQQGPMAQRVQRSLGSGVIVRPDGVILTNNHVIRDAQEITVALPDRREFPARVILADKRTDLAVLKIDVRGERLPALSFGDSDQTQVGDLVLAIGDPYGVGQTVTSGIVSALARTQVGASDYQFFIQTDAAINPGNSGGALVTMDGRLVGINAAIYSQTGGNVGIGFAVPSNMARLVVEGALGGGIKRPWFGADGQAVTSEIARSLGLSRPQGVVIANIYPGSPAAQGGLAKGDVVTAIDEFPVNSPPALRYRVATMRPGDTATIKFIRGGAERQANVQLATPPETPPRNTTTITGENPMQGAKVANLSPALADELQLNVLEKGVVVLSVEAGSTAARFGFRQGDIVRQVNGAHVVTVSGLKTALESQRGWAMAIQRGAQTLKLSVR